MNDTFLLIKSIFRKFGADIRNAKHTEEGILRNILGSKRPVAVLDVGANTGQYAMMLRSIGYDGTIISFEALKTAHLQLSKHAARDAHWIVAPCLALGSGAAIAEINVSANSVSSSLLPLTCSLTEAAPEARYLEKQVVEIERLDALLPKLFAASGDLFLKIDTQGYERHVLSGASATLARVTAIQLEISLTQLYEGAPTLVQMLELMQALGYELFQLIPGFRTSTTGRLLQVDGIFVRRPVAD
jgi:FkbM family methyltransferase